MKLKQLSLLLCLLVITWSLAATEPNKYTNKDSITLKGTADSNLFVDIFVNDKKVDTVQADDQGEWFAANVPLTKEGNNSVYAIARSDDGSKSRFSTKLVVCVDKIPPQIYDFIVEPKLVKPTEVVHVTVRTDKDVDTVAAVMPDSTILNLVKNGSGKTEAWLGDWTVPRLISGGIYRLMLMVTDKAGNVTQQNSDELQIDAIASLTISAPDDGSITYDEVANVKGIARNSLQVLLNEEKVPVQADSQFSGYVKLKPGRNRITAKAFDPAGTPLEAAVNVIRLITYPDIKTHWAKREIEYLATLGYIQAYPDTNVFMPENNISRAELATLMVRTKQFPLTYVGMDKPTFLDIQQNYWAIGYIETAARYGLVEGYPGHIYRPQNKITRAEAAAMFVRFAQIPVLKAERDADIDVPKSHWAAGYIAAFKAAGLTPSDWQNRRFYPDRPITRAEVAAILARVSDINREIEQLLGRKVNWEYSLENAEYAGTQVQGRTAPPPISPAQNQNIEASSIVIGIVSPKEVVINNDLNLTVATLIRMKQVQATFPDGTKLPLQLNTSTDLWEVNWRVAQGTKSGEYSIVIEAIDQTDKKYSAATSKFKVLSVEDTVKQIKTAPLEENLSMQQTPENDERTVFEAGQGKVEKLEYVYPEFMENNKTIPQVSAMPQASKEISSAVSGVPLTRARMTEILAKYNKLRVAKVSAAPAKDVPLSHPQVSTIKSGIVTGIVPNITSGMFYPERAVTKAEAAKVLAKLKISSTAGQGTISEEEFDNWVKKSVK